MEISTEKLRELLVNAGHVGEAHFVLALNEAKKEHVSLLDILGQGGYISEEKLGRIIAAAFDYRFIDLKKEKITKQLLDVIPESIARLQQAVLFRELPNEVYLATADPQNLEFINMIQKKTGKHVLVYYATPTNIREVLNYYSNTLEQIQTLVEKMKTHFDENGIVQLVNLFLEYSYYHRASDIHLEPMEDTVSVRFRIDGVLHEMATYPLSLHDKIVFRLKIMAHLRTDEHAAAQDGRFEFKKEDMSFDVRMSILPVSSGENIVMRVLTEHAQRYALEALGLMDHDYEKVNRAVSKPHGMILSTGPTGSGKTTTLYAVLQKLNDPTVNIMTIEDPIEYHMEHVQQIQVNPKKNLLFSTGLRSIVRQDPDIIMVGEVRDDETAKIAVNAAMTGHLVLSTLHANDAATTFPRLLDMGVEPFLVASSVNVVIAQRLVRKICERCRVSYLLEGPEAELINSYPMLKEMIDRMTEHTELSKLRLYKGGGCTVCGGSGYTGRTGIFEVMEITDEIRALITQKAASNLIDKKARESGMLSMLEDGLAKVFQGQTTLGEVLRVIKI